MHVFLDHGLARGAHPLTGPQSRLNVFLRVLDQKKNKKMFRVFASALDIFYKDGDSGYLKVKKNDSMLTVNNACVSRIFDSNPLLFTPNSTGFIFW